MEGEPRPSYGTPSSLNTADDRFHLHDTLAELWCMRVKSLQSCPTLGDPVDCGPWGSSVHGVLQAVILEWVACPSQVPPGSYGGSHSGLQAWREQPAPPPGEPGSVSRSLSPQRLSCMAFRCRYLLRLYQHCGITRAVLGLLTLAELIQLTLAFTLACTENVQRG